MGEIRKRHKVPEITPELLYAVKNGDTEAFEALYLNLFRPLTRFLAMLLRDSAEAEDVAQDVMMKVFERREAIKPESNFKSYLFVIAKTEVLMRLRHKKVQDKFYNHTVNTDDGMDLSPDEIMMNKELELILKIYVMNMPAQRRRVFELSRYEGKTNEEIAQELNISIFTVRRHLQDAINGCREIIVLFVMLFVSL